jgi:hypothetical protein
MLLRHVLTVNLAIAVTSLASCTGSSGVTVESQTQEPKGVWRLSGTATPDYWVELSVNCSPDTEGVSTAASNTGAWTADVEGSAGDCITIFEVATRSGDATMSSLQFLLGGPVTTACAID